MPLALAAKIQMIKNSSIALEFNLAGQLIGLINFALLIFISAIFSPL